jgi:hypothetical protein
MSSSCSNAGIRSSIVELHPSALRRETVLLNVRDSAASEQFFCSIFENTQPRVTFFNARQSLDIGVA